MVYVRKQQLFLSFTQTWPVLLLLLGGRDCLFQGLCHRFHPRQEEVHRPPQQHRRQRGGRQGSQANQQAAAAVRQWVSGHRALYPVESLQRKWCHYLLALTPRKCTVVACSLAINNVQLCGISLFPIFQRPPQTEEPRWRRCRRREREGLSRHEPPVGTGGAA